MQPHSQSDVLRTRVTVLGAPIDALGWDEALDRTAHWAAERSSRILCFCNVHSVVTRRDDPALAAAIDGADLALPDGMPVAWSMRRAGVSGQPRVDGPGFMWKFCALAEQRGIGVYFYGSTPETLAALRRRLLHAFPDLAFGMESPPFRALSAKEDAEAVARIADSGAGLVFVGLGCPRQEAWMAAHRGRIRAVMAGVGAAFDYHAGTQSRAPLWMQQRGLEWLHRLASEPGRLWRRYLVTNLRFALGMVLSARRGAVIRLRREPR